MFGHWHRRPTALPRPAAPPVASWPRGLAEQCSPFGPVPLQDLHPYYELLRPCAPHRYSDPRGSSRLRSLPWHRNDRFSRSIQEPGPASRRLPAGCRSGSLQDNPRTDPGRMASPRFRHRLIRFRRFISGSLALASLGHTCRDLVPTFLQRSPPSLFTTAACSGLGSAPDCRNRGAYPHLSYSIAPPCVRDTQPIPDI